MSSIIDIEGAVKHYQRGVEEVRAIDGVDLRVSRGDYLAIVGRSGSGKTTLLNLIGCLDRPTSGRVTVHGMETGELSEKALATIRSTTIGFVFQHFFLLPTLTAMENVMVPGRFSARHNGDLESRARQLLDRVGLEERADHLPRELSGGEMQRVALARALVNDPAILLADEPTGNLDSRSAEGIAAIFRELNNEGLTLVVVTHGTELTGDSTRIVHLLDGRIVEEERLRPVRTRAPVPVREAERETVGGLQDIAESGDVEPGPSSVAVPDYMPSSLKKREWGSPAAAASLVLLGALMFAAAFMPFAGGSSGWRLLDGGLLTTRFIAENSTRLYTGKTAVLFTGMWPMALGLLLIAAGILILFNHERIGTWIAAVIGLLGSAVALFDIARTSSRLSPEASVGYGLWVMLAAGAGALALGLGLLLDALRRARRAAEIRDRAG